MVEHPVARSFILQAGDELSITTSHHIYFLLSSLRRIPKNSKSRKQNILTLSIRFSYKSEIQKIVLKEDMSLFVPQELKYYKDGTYTFTKSGSDDLQIVFIADKIPDLNLFTFYNTNNPKSMPATVPENNTFYISFNFINPLIQEIRRSLKSPNPIFVLAQIFNQFFQYSFFSSYNNYYRKISQNKFLKYIEQSLFLCFNRIGKDKLTEYFQSSVDFFDFQITMQKKLSFGLGFVLLSILNYCQEDAYLLSRLFYTHTNYLIILGLLASLRPPLDEIVLSKHLQIPFPPVAIQPYHYHALSALFQFVYRRVFRDKPESKIRFMIHYSYQNLFENVAPSEELNLLNLHKCLVGLNKLPPKNFNNEIALSDSLSFDIAGNPDE